MQLLMVMVLALALSVPVGSAVAVFGALLLEFVLGYVIEAGEKIESDPARRKAVLTIGGLVLMIGCVCICSICALGAWFLATRR